MTETSGYKVGGPRPSSRMNRLMYSVLQNTLGTGAVCCVVILLSFTDYSRHTSQFSFINSMFHSESVEGSGSHLPSIKVIFKVSL